MSPAPVRSAWRPRFHFRLLCLSAASVRWRPLCCNPRHDAAPLNQTEEHREKEAGLEERAKLRAKVK